MGFEESLQIQEVVRSYFWPYDMLETPLTGSAPSLIKTPITLVIRAPI